MRFRGAAFSRGEGCQQDAAKAAEWFKQAADRGDAIASDEYGMRLFQGMGIDCDKVAGARSKLSADAGWRMAWGHYAECLLAGESVEHNTEEAARYIRLAASRRQ
jgi:hypothetical protein